MSKKQASVSNDEEYQAMSTRIVNCAIKIESSLTSESDKVRYRAVYDEMCKVARQYRRSNLAKEFPGLRAIYAELGWSVNPQEAEAVPEPKKASNADFLD